MRMSLDSLRNLEKNWNLYDADPLRNEFVSEVEAIIDTFPQLPLYVAPTARNSIQCDWESGDYFLEVEIFDNPRYASVFTDEMDKNNVEDGIQIEISNISKYINEFIHRSGFQA